jgi:alpha/beta superfamily hydrolase
MRASAPATSRQETPLFFAAGEDVLFGILTSPTADARGVAVVVAAGGGTPLSTSVNGLSVRLCRGISRYGFHAFRFDYHGVGESTGTLDRFHLGEPYVRDLAAAVECLRDQGIRRYVLLGSCFGARTALATAPSTEGLEGVILISPPTRDFEMGERISTRMAAELGIGEYVRRAMTRRALAGLLQRDRRRAYTRLAKEKLRHAAGSRNGDSGDRQARYEVSPGFLEPLRALVERGVPVSIFYGDAEDFFADFERARSGALGRILEAAGETIAVTTIPGEIHGFEQVEAQEKVLDSVMDRLTRFPQA